MKPFLFVVSSPDGDVFRGGVISVSLRGTEGDLAVMAGHIPFVTSIVPCDCKLEQEDGSVWLGHTDGGILHIQKEKTVLFSGSFSWLSASQAKRED